MDKAITPKYCAIYVEPLSGIDYLITPFNKGVIDSEKRWFIEYFSRINDCECEGFTLVDGKVNVKLKGRDSYEIAYTKGWNEKIIKLFDL